MTGAKFDIEKFDGTGDFGLWRIKMRALLIQHGCEAAREVLPADMEAEAKAELNKKAHSAVILCLGNKVLREVTGETTATGVWTKLETFYMTKSLATLNSKEIKERSKAKGDDGEGLYVRGRTDRRDSRQSRGKSRSKSRGGRLKCYICQSEDHLKRNCPKNNHKKSTGYVNKDDQPSSSGSTYDDSKVMMVMSAQAQALLDLIMDSGCSYHMTPRLNILFDFLECDGGIIQLGDNMECKIKGIGKVKVQLKDGSSFVLHNVRYIPELKRNLISMGTLEKERYTVKMQSDKVKVINGSRVVLSGTRRTNCVYSLVGHAVAGELNASVDEKDSLVQVWHKRLGHISEAGLQVLEKQGLFGKESLGKLDFCENYVLGKSHRVSRFGVEGPLLQRSGRLCYSDLWGRSLRFKHEAFRKFKEWNQLVENQNLDEYYGGLLKPLASSSNWKKNTHDHSSTRRTVVVKIVLSGSCYEENGFSEEEQDMGVSRSSAGQSCCGTRKVVARGFTQRADYELEKLDVKTAFLHGNLEEVIYMRQPPGYEQGNKVCLLKKSLYGLKQSPRQWYRRFDEYMLSNGFKRSSYDSCVYYRSYAPGDDMKEAREAKKILGNDDIERMSKVPYANAVGSLMYLMVCTRPDIAYAVSVVSRYLANPGKNHWEAVKWILKYLRGTANVGLVYGTDRGNYVDVTGFVDSDYAKDPDKGRSITGYAFLVQGCVVSWKATLQHVVALSTTEAEYMALTEAVKEAIWLRGLLEELGVELNTVAVNCDNQGAIHLSWNHVFHERTKHINVRYHFIREVLEAKTVKVLKVGTEHNAAGALTKVVPRLKLQHCLELLSVGIG
ncbi:retrovirus-related pol polyprotein from transposon TNT 1-94 [Tanacetum coccineum]